jgi:hypothetical protein
MTLKIQASPVPAVPHDRRFPWYVLIAPGIVALGFLAMRLAVHDGSWQAVPAYVALLAVCGLGALTSSAFAAYASAEGRRPAAFLGWFTAQIAASAGLMTALWWLLPLRFVGP